MKRARKRVIMFVIFLIVNVDFGTQPSASVTNKFQREIDKKNCISAKIVEELLSGVRAPEFAGSHRPLSATGSKRQPGSVAFQLKSHNFF